MSDTALTVEALPNLMQIYAQLHHEVEDAHRRGDSWAKAESQGRLDQFETSGAELGCFLIRRALERTPKMLAYALEGSSTIAQLSAKLERVEHHIANLAERIEEVEDHIAEHHQGES